MTNEAPISSHIIHMYTLRKGDRELLHCLYPSHAAMIKLMSVAAHTTHATAISVLVMDSFLKSFPTKGPNGVIFASGLHSLFMPMIID